MLNTQLIQIIVVLLFVFLVMAGIVSVVQQFIVQAFRLRALNLRHTITRLLEDDVYHDEIVKRFFSHPSTAALSGGQAAPTEIKPEVFVSALAAAIQPDWSTGDATDALPASIAALKEGALKRRLSLVMPPPGANRDSIVKAMTDWYSAAEQKMSERFKADCVALSYITAIVVTLLFNVSTIEVVTRLQNNGQLRQALASIASSQSGQAFAALGGDPTLTQSATPQGLAGFDGAADTSAPATTQHVDPQKAFAAQAALSCVSSRTDLPIGWDWMAALVAKVNKGADDACGAAVSNLDPQTRASLANIAPAYNASQPSTVSHIYGPTFGRNGIALVLLGWLITVVAAAQGAPFWFNTIKRITGR